MKYTIHILLIVMAGFLFSCESLVTTVPESRLPKGIEKVVLHAYISPQDTLILVKLTASRPLLGVYNKDGVGYTVIGNDTIYFTGGIIENANVILSNSRQQYISIPYIKNEATYILDASRFPIEAGETYTIKAETPIGNVEATCTVPPGNAIIEKYKIDTTTENFFNGRSKTFHVNFDWKDIPSQANYYTMKASVTTKMLLEPTTANHNPEKTERIITYYAFWDEENRQAQYQSDISRDGTLFSTPNGNIPLNLAVIYLNDKVYMANFAGEKSTIRLEVLNTDKNYYDYHRAVRINNRQDGNPFVEPVPIPTNVKNGLGCFAATNKSILTVVF
ncbi:DUF4249 domain-containing protein [Emticicia sp. BO119]|uniref:DUF4249 domain-containing protein n=1 Tax=Emticicia sp. BO119 TaxID=2757768 RepID=UPI0015F0F443|nr:DUF4249 domain-containing protein [Emticicia sp. BO119]MBA4851175.1 DUF4249 domain-containing protein [Emticicia sp. BO119]